MSGPLDAVFVLGGLALLGLAEQRAMQETAWAGRMAAARPAVRKKRPAPRVASDTPRTSVARPAAKKVSPEPMTPPPIHNHTMSGCTTKFWWYFFVAGFSFARVGFVCVDEGYHLRPAKLHLSFSYINKSDSAGFFLSAFLKTTCRSPSRNVYLLPTALCNMYCILYNKNNALHNSQACRVLERTDILQYV